MLYQNRSSSYWRMFRISASKRSLLSLAIVFVILESSYLIIESYWNPLRSIPMYKVETTSNLQWSTSPTLKDIMKKNVDESHPDYRCIKIFLSSNASSRDLDIYTTFLNTSLVRNPNSSLPSRADIIFEEFQHSDLRVSSRLIWIPHDDWQPNQFVHENVSLILARTRGVLERLQDYRRRTKRDFTLLYTKLSGIDNFQGGLPKQYDEFLYVANLQEDPYLVPILQAWAQNPSWPKLTILSNLPQHALLFQQMKTINFFDHVHFIDKFTQQDLHNIQNNVSLHLFPRTTTSKTSVYDLNLARSTASVIIAPDIAPYNELIHDEAGILIARKKNSDGKLIRSNHYDEVFTIKANDVARGVEKVLDLPIEERKMLGEKARQRYLADRRHFRVVMEAFADLICSRDRSLPFSFDALTHYVQ